MTNKSLAALFFGCILTASAASAQSLLPKPQSFVAGKGSFSTTAKLKVVNEVGAEAENIYSKQFTANTADDARQVVRFTRLDGASSPEAYRLHVTKDTLLISAASVDGFRFAWQTINQLKQKNAVIACEAPASPSCIYLHPSLLHSFHVFPSRHAANSVRRG